MDNPQPSVTEVEMGWLVGILDGEGHVSAYAHKSGKHYNPTIKFVNTSPRIIEKLVDILKRLGCAYYIFDSWRAANQRPAKRVEINGLLRVQRFLSLVVKHDFAKKEESVALLKYINIRLGQPKNEAVNEEQQKLIDFVRSRCAR